MRLKGNRSLPYPCLYANVSGREDVPSIRFRITGRNLVQTRFHADVTCANRELQALVHEGKAEYCLELDCRRTFYRDAFHSATGVFDWTLANDRFNGHVHGILSVVAVGEIRGYQNESFDEFYRKFDVHMEPGEALAYLGEIDFSMEVKSREVKSVSDDFIVVVRDSSIRYSQFDLGGDKIRLKLPDELYAQYLSPRISRNEACAPFLHASFLLNVLSAALRDMGGRRTKWAEALRSRILIDPELRRIALGGEADGDAFGEDGRLENPETANDLAQEILGNPYERLLASLNNLNSQDDD